MLLAALRCVMRPRMGEDSWLGGLGRESLVWSELLERDRCSRARREPPHPKLMFQ